MSTGARFTWCFVSALADRCLHVVALPHTTLTEKDASCAYSMKVLKFVPMMRAQGCHVILYGPDEIECEPDEHVVITTEADRRRWGYGGPTGYDTTTPFEWDWQKPYWFEANTRAIDAIEQRVRREKGHFLCLITGTQWPIANAISGTSHINPICVEWGVGYEGVFTPFCAYESYAWMHHVYGIRKKGDGIVYDQVIPNFFDKDQFYVTRRPSKDYLLYLGRVVPRKGVEIAHEVAKRIGLPLVIAGPGAHVEPDGAVQTNAGGAEHMRFEDNVQYVGAVGFERRAELMTNAAAVLMPTKYIEPFGGVAVEAMLSGAPVIASDWGSFTEIVTPDVGRRFRTIAQGVTAFQEVEKLNRKKIRESAVARFSLEAVGPMFMRWFDQLDGLWGKGMYE